MSGIRPGLNEGWTVVHKDEEDGIVVFPETIAGTRSRAIQKFLRAYNVGIYNTSWRTWRRKGYSCEKVQVVYGWTGAWGKKSLQAFYGKDAVQED